MDVSIRSVAAAFVVAAVAALALAIPTPGFAGPNAGGTLIVHTDEQIQYSTDGGSYVGRSGIACGSDEGCSSDELERCKTSMLAANPTGRNDRSTQVWWVFAAFPEHRCPRVSAVSFGHSWSRERSLSITDWGAAGDFEVTTSGWPTKRSGGGTAVTWSTPQESHLIEVYWFAGSAYYEGEVVQLTAHPTQGASFADDSVPAIVDPIAGLSRLGFLGASGRNVQPVMDGACCLSDAGCVAATLEDCEDQDGDYRGDGTVCQDVGCPVVPVVDTSWGEIKAVFR